MKYTRKTFQRHVLATAVVMALAGAANAQLSTSTIRGTIGSAPKGTAVTAVNTATGNTYRTVTLANGVYTITGLAPGSYEIRVGSSKSEVITVSVGETASLDLNAGAQQVTVVGATARKDVKNSEAGVTVSKHQIDTLPQTTRNFLAFADLAPGVRFVQDSNGYTRIQGGAQGSDRVNVFIDGVSQKNDVTRGGIAGQNESRGNPFPQSAIAEYKVITQNYKAEFGSVSSTAITAVTKSGTNTLHGDIFGDYAAGSQIAYSPLEKAAEASGTTRPKAKQTQYGASIGGAIIPDKLHYFVAYEAKDNTVPVQVRATNLEGVTQTDFVKSLLAKQYSASRPFHEDLIFGKLNLALDDLNRFEMSVKVRNETDESKLGSEAQDAGLISTRENVQNRKQSEGRFDLKYERSADTWMNEARIGYESSKFTPKSDSTNTFIEYKRTNWSNIMWDGAVISAENKRQKGFLLQDDFTYSGMAGHVMKVGVKLKAMDYTVEGSKAVVPHAFIFVNKFGVANPLTDDDGKTQDFLTGAPNYPAWEKLAKTGRPMSGAKYKNKQFSIYLQDDWSVTKQLELNLGLRWDYEDNALNNDYVTPTAVVSALTGADTRTGAAAGQTYAQSLAKGGVNIYDYISTGSNRKAFKGAIQPRLGFSYDLMGDKSSVIVAGAGRAYDRTPASKAQDEVYNNTVQGGEIWLLRNNMKMPYADQFGLSLRQRVGIFDAEFGIRKVFSYNEFFWASAGRGVDGSSGSGAPFDRSGGLGPSGWGDIQIGDTFNQTRTTVGFLTLTKPYTRSSGWGFGMTYTNSDGKTTSTGAAAESGDSSQYSWGVGKTYGTVFRKAIDVEKHRVIFDGSTDNLLPWGIMAGAKYTLGSGTGFEVTSCAAGWGAACQRHNVDGGHFEQADLMLSKDFSMPGIAGSKLSFRFDILNLFNKANFGKYETWGGGPTSNPQNAWGGDNPNAGKPLSMGGPMRTVKLGVKYSF